MSLQNYYHYQNMSRSFATNLRYRCKCGYPNHVTVLNAGVNMMPQVGGHVGCQVPEAVEGPKGEVKRKSADQSKDSVELLRREHLRNGRTNSHF